MNKMKKIKINKIKNKINKSLKKSGGAGYRSLCLMHAKHALYHLSYTPNYVVQLGWLSW